MYRVLNAVVVRAAVSRPDQLPPWPDLSDQTSPAPSRTWLRQVLSLPALATALLQASPALFERARAICDGRDIAGRDERRVVLAVMRYVLRATGRATPFGLFAGVAPAHTGAAGAVRLGVQHRAVARMSAEWLTAVVDLLEADPGIRPLLTVRANNLLIERDGHLVLEHRANRLPGGAPTHVQVRATAPIRTALTLARDPIRLHDLVAKLAIEFNVSHDTVAALAAGMVEQRLLLTNLRPAMTTTSPLDGIIAEADLAMADADGDSPALDRAAGILSGLRDVARQIAGHDTSSTSADRGDLRRRLAVSAAAMCPTGDPVVAVDLRLDCDLVVPDVVTAEAARAAGVLARLSRHPARTGWAAWHSRFLERYGPHAVVPVLDAVNADIGLGFPTGYQGGPPLPPATVSDRDRKLLALAQQAALGRQQEILLDDATITDLAGDEPVTSMQPSTELTVRVHATSKTVMEQGDFRLAVVAVSRHAGTTTGRFLDLFDPADRQRMTDAYASVPTMTRGALRAQISTATPYTVTADVARTPQVLTHLIPVGEYHDNQPGHIALTDIAVTADANRLHLVSVSRRKVLEPVVLNAVESVHHTLPIVRFLAEAPTALARPCTVFDWGAAASLPFLPAIRHGRTIVSPARWLLTSTDLPGPHAGWPEWNAALTAWREAHGCPAVFYLGEADQRIRLDLAQSAHHALLRDQLARSGAAQLRAAPAADADGWFAGHAQELVIPLAATTQPAPEPRLPDPVRAVKVREHGHLPSGDTRSFLKLYGHPARQTTIITEHLPALLSELAPDIRWWFLRYGDPEPHLRLRLTGNLSAADVGGWAQRLRRAGLVARVQYDTDYPETSRFGGPMAHAAVEDVFGADSAAALAQLTTTSLRTGPDLLALTAASMLRLLIGLIGDTAGAMRWLIENTRTHQPPPPRPVYDQALHLANPHSDTAVAALGHGEQILSSWQHRRTALARYRHALQDTGTDPANLAPDLLHLHHARMVGIDLDSERACLHLARAAALSWTTRSRTRP